MTNSKTNVFGFLFFCLNMGITISKCCYTCALVTYTKCECIRGYYNKPWSCWPLSFWKQLRMPVISCINSSQLSQEHSTNPCHKCIAVYHIYFHLNYSQNLVLLHILKIATPILLCVTLLCSQEVGQCYKQCFIFTDKEIMKYKRGTATLPESFWKSIMRQAINYWGQGLLSAVWWLLQPWCGP